MSSKGIKNDGTALKLKDGDELNKYCTEVVTGNR